MKQSLIDELESVITHRDLGSRANVLRRVTDLFVAGANNVSNEQRALFDDVMVRLVKEIDNAARATFGKRLITITNAPPKVSRALALDDAIEVAAPLLTHSDQLDGDTLVFGAKTKSQDHLLAISKRKSLPEDVTDVLVTRGNQAVILSAAANTGAEFSEFGYSTLVSKSEGNEDLALTVWARSEVPREHLLSLFSKASETVRAKLEVADRRKSALISNIIKQASDQIQTRLREQSTEFGTARERVEVLHRTKTLTEQKLREFAEAYEFDATVLALSFMADMPIGAVERVLVNDSSDQVLVLAKSIGLSWATTKAILMVLANAKPSTACDLDSCLVSFKKLKSETAKAAIRFYRLREAIKDPSSPVH